MSEISRDEVAHLARLSRLALTEEELIHFAEQIDGIVETVAAVQEVDTEGVAPLSHPTQNVDGDVSVMREDVPEAQHTAEQALAQAPKQAQDRYQVPRILGE
ncbi:MAG: Asp-tRNA(Asn)/Glu-tRNA(Gln) amidotransferase subunit GatC [Corynebacterium variabile]|uniref:Asp-tRNA(Asn)/Glu-tRNA(Gln) amidotransferase subunit GatC n=1 Tax=Corynebacterium variabile TaxID=1727 RepID=UPI00264746E2|nr:Asp-tRNA(Asn)/Glu-tRNA(Gln) amidotransferase subunit GatC [Corynebacterium variabile]MDN6535565.1 Asp-tRNA(Asn)/Glu-tRNA(Gln) amidotransferase subunit GatC [Corynebacterium variabile]